MITMQDVSVCLGDFDILKNINITFSRHDFTCLVGKNGSGKSTLLKSILGSVPYQGDIFLDYIHQGDMSSQSKARKVSYMPQQRDVPQMDVKTLLAHGRYPHLSFSKVLREEDYQKIKEAAQIADIEGLLDRAVPSLSGGERQRVYIAMMIAQDADMILLDEPTTFLDIEHQIEVLNLLKKLHKKGKGIVMVAHDLPQAFTYATQLILIQQGQIVLQGEPQNIYQDKKLKENFGVHLKLSQDANELYTYQLRK